MKKLFSLLLTLALLLSLAACGAAGPVSPAADGAAGQTGESPAGDQPGQSSAGQSGPVGTWTLSEAGDSTYAPGQVTLVLDEDGGGYQSVTQFKDDFVYNDYLELRWSEGAIIIDGVGGVYLLQGDTLTLTWNEVTSTYVRASDAPSPLAPAPGSYTSTVVYEEGEAYPDDSFSITLNADGSGSYTGNGDTLPLTWNRYFITLDGDQSFYYVFDGSQITLYDGEYQIVLAAD
jgi:predicted small lipoprotein YifL